MAVDQLTRKIIIARMLLSNNKIVSSRFFEQTNFEQLIMTPMSLKFCTGMLFSNFFGHSANTKSGIFGAPKCEIF